MKRLLKRALIGFIALCVVYLDATDIKPAPALTGAGISAPSAWADADVARFTLATYNIRRSKGNDDVRDIARAGGVLERAGADIVGLNELSGTLFYGLTNQAEQLAQLLDLGHLFAPTERQFYQDNFGNGLLSRFAVARWQVLPLYDGRAQSNSLRNMIIAQVPFGARTLHVLITHLDRGDIRTEQLRQVIEAYQALPAPAVLLGDLNTDASEPQLRDLLRDPQHIDAIDEMLRIEGIADSDGRIDWLIAKGLSVEGGGFEPPGISDHPGFWVEFGF